MLFFNSPVLLLQIMHAIIESKGPCEDHCAMLDGEQIASNQSFLLDKLVI